MSFFTTLKTGQRYLKLWPLEPKLGMIFPENRIIRATGFAQKLMPFFAVFAVVWQQIYAKSDIGALAVAVLTAVFALCLPLQGLYWLGKRADTPLSAQSAVWFEKICVLLRQQNEVIMPLNGAPTYLDLAQVLRKTQQKLDRDFWQNL
ncbi:terminus macrodomain insulation protein YfbV [Caviibacterium pharyngocola]|uniref:UPF0208 membrane protein CVP04_07945 n=1 Tax=Caviibacterium pharyngocola TaxID=28159 RepID=A0A2M8RV17_9PAST|nr:terminus macrodomain insulation protein YfbV [Caviibacterium pharyngocola]PJG82724.1 hypothetical protein CVP04_07945 [Caviibacterium pharyngocola]